MKLIRWVDRISEWTGTLSAWLVVPLMLVVIFEVARRKILNAPSGWGYDTCWMLFSAQFLLGGAFTLLRKGHIRIDIVYTALRPRTQLVFDTIIYSVVFLLPAVLFTWAGVIFAADAWASGEKLSTTNWFFPAGPSKSLIPLGFFLLGLQCVAEVIRNIRAMAKGSTE